MKNKKWIIILVFVVILIIVLAISLTKCGKESQKTKGKNNETENVTATKAGTKAKKTVSEGQAETGKPAEVTSNSGETVTPGNEAGESTPVSGEGSKGSSGSSGGAKATTSTAATPASSGTSSHTHSYGAWVNNQNGTKTRSCSCGDVETTSATWVVDQPAWTETVNKTRTETRYRPTWWGRLRDGTIKTFYSEEEVYNAYGDTVVAWGNGEDEAYTVEVPYTETIEHPEVGHWE